MSQFGLLAGTLGSLYLANLFGPPPPSVSAVALSGIIAMPVFWAWANQVDRRLGGGRRSAGA